VCIARDDSRRDQRGEDDERIFGVAKAAALARDDDASMSSTPTMMMMMMMSKSFATLWVDTHHHPWVLLVASSRRRKKQRSVVVVVSRGPRCRQTHTFVGQSRHRERGFIHVQKCLFLSAENTTTLQYYSSYRNEDIIFGLIESESSVPLPYSRRVSLGLYYIYMCLPESLFQSTQKNNNKKKIWVCCV
jgi:hypothetical protein